LRTTVDVTTMSLGGLLKHMAYVEDLWFSRCLLGNEPSSPWDRVDWKSDRDWEWHTALTDPPESLRSLWAEAVAHSRACLADALTRGGLDPVVNPRGGHPPCG
jgi:uncharacterized damage-inducible protein DinB